MSTVTIKCLAAIWFLIAKLCVISMIFPISETIAKSPQKPTHRISSGSLRTSDLCKKCKTVGRQTKNGIFPISSDLYYVYDGMPMNPVKWYHSPRRLRSRKKILTLHQPHILQIPSVLLNNLQVLSDNKDEVALNVDFTPIESKYPQLPEMNSGDDNTDYEKPRLSNTKPLDGTKFDKNTTPDPTLQDSTFIIPSSIIPKEYNNIENNIAIVTDSEGLSSSDKFTTAKPASLSTSFINTKVNETKNNGGIISNNTDINFVNFTKPSYNTEDVLTLRRFQKALDQFQRRFYLTTFTKLSTNSPPARRENGISFVFSGLFLYLVLMALSLEVDHETKAEIDHALLLEDSDKEKIQLIRNVLNKLPSSSEELKFMWSMRLIVNGSYTFVSDGARTLQLKVDGFDKSETPENLTKMLNRMVETDSGGAMRNTFEEEELTGGVRGVLLNTLYVRARWRSAPTLLNGSRHFFDSDNLPARTTRMIRINDIMGYLDLPDWDAEAIEISYSTPGLSLILLVPRGRSLRGLSEIMSGVTVEDIIAKMRTLRVAAILPIYTLRMTLLLPNKLEAVGIKNLMNVSSDVEGTQLRLSHAEQRLMFWAEAGRNAFKDDGIEWDEPPHMELLVDRPYIFFVRWHNLTMMTGHFVL